MTDHANELRRHARKIPHPKGETPGVMLRAADEIERLQRMIASPHKMTRDDVIRMAREAGLLIPSFRIGVGLALGTCTVPDFERFASLVAEAEREACARACEDLRGTVSMFATSKDCRTHNNAIAGCIKAISARGAAAQEAKP